MTKEEFKQLAEEHLFILEGSNLNKEGNKEIKIYGFDALFDELNIPTVVGRIEQLKCEHELNYLSERIEELTLYRDWNERETAKRDHSKMRSDMMELVDRLNTEIELLENILNVVTEHALT